MKPVSEACSARSGIASQRSRGDAGQVMDSIDLSQLRVNSEPVGGGRGHSCVCIEGVVGGMSGQAAAAWTRAGGRAVGLGSVGMACR